jgi:hypothetical protein
MDNYLELEILLAERIKIQTGIYSLGIVDLYESKPGQLPSPSVYISLHNDDPSTNIGKQQHTTQDWFVVPIIRVSSDKTSKGIASSSAGNTIMKIIRAIHDWTPQSIQIEKPPKYKKFARIKSPQKPFADYGFIHYPLLFRTEFVFNIE